MCSDGCSLLVGTHNGVRRINLKTKEVTTLGLFDAKIPLLATNKTGDIYIGTCGKLLKLREAWKTIRLLWVAHLKEDGRYCLLATLPRDLIKEIITMMKEWRNSIVYEGHFRQIN